ncbi:MAG: hypothetical protein V9G14_12960 [Cypionkella sp.]
MADLFCRSYFGALLDLTGIYTSCFMLLFLIVVVIALGWMHMSIRAMERSAMGERAGPPARTA